MLNPLTFNLVNSIWISLSPPNVYLIPLSCKYCPSLTITSHFYYLYHQTNILCINTLHFDFINHKSNSTKNICKAQWKGINRKQSTRWQHLSRLKASEFFSLQKKISCYETQQLILGTGTAIWWVTEPHCHQILIKITEWKSMVYKKKNIII